MMNCMGCSRLSVSNVDDPLSIGLHPRGVRQGLLHAERSRSRTTVERIRCRGQCPASWAVEVDDDIANKPAVIAPCEDVVNMFLFVPGTIRTTVGRTSRASLRGRKK